MKNNTLYLLLSMFKNLYLNMFFAVTVGVLGFLCAIFLPTMIIYYIFNSNLFFDNILLVLITLGLFRGIFRYIEQYNNHYIAFKILAIFRNRIFNKLRKLAINNKDNKGDILSTVTSDIELIEVFYAHTVSPILIGIIMLVILLIIFGSINIFLFIIALISYILIGVILPSINVYFKTKNGEDYRENISLLNQYFLDKINGIFDIAQYYNVETLNDEIDSISSQTEDHLSKVKRAEIILANVTEVSLILSYVIFITVGITLLNNNQLDMYLFLFAIILFMNSFGPFIALNNLSNNLIQTIASIKRVMKILKEPNSVRNGNKKIEEVNSIKLQNVSFEYLDNQNIINNLSYEFKQGKIYGIYAPSGIGKTTLLKIINSDLSPTKGLITYNGIDANEFDQYSINESFKYMDQSFYYFNDSIKNNIDLNNKFITVEDKLKEVHLEDAIDSLNDKENTILYKNRKVLSSGELQRLNLLRSTIYNSSVLLLDEPTSNVDSMNESIILNSIRDNSANKIIIIVSHKESSLNICDEIITSLN